MAAWVATGAGQGSGLAWLGLGASILALGTGLGLGSWTLPHVAVGILGLLLLLRDGDRLLIAPLYGGGLLLILELARISIQLGEVEAVAPAALWGRLWAILLVASLGTASAAVAALATTGAPGRSAADTAAGAAAIGALVGGVVWSARRAVHAVSEGAVRPARRAGREGSPDRDGHGRPGRGQR